MGNPDAMDLVRFNRPAIDRDAPTLSVGTYELALKGRLVKIEFQFRTVALTLDPQSHVVRH
jgi:hypothetical protein